MVGNTVKLIDIGGCFFLDAAFSRSTCHYRHGAISSSGAAEPDLSIHTVHWKANIARTERVKKVRGQPCLRMLKVLVGCRVDELINKHPFEKVPRCDGY